jgi:SLOG in TRPM, prokaryote
MNRWEIHFPNGNSAWAVRCPIGTPPIDLLRSLHIQRPRALMMITGGASEMDEQVDSNLARLFTQGIAPVAISMGAMIIDGGTRAGVMKMIGKAMSGQRQRSILLGVSAEGRVIYPGKPVKADGQTGTQLDPNHSHFILVETNVRGEETETMYGLAGLLSNTCPSVAILSNGGPIAAEEVVQNVLQQRPVIVITGSGRFADDLAGFRQGQSPDLPDSRLAEIIAQGDFHFFPIDSAPSDFARLILRLLGEQ